MIPLPIASKLLAGALVAAVAWGAAGEWRVRGLQLQIERAKSEVAAEEARRQEAAQEVTRNANQSRARDQAHAVALDAVAGRLRQQIGAILTARTGSASGGAPTPDPGLVCADLLGRAEERLRALAEEADRRRTAGLACEAAYRSLTR